MYFCAYKKRKIIFYAMEIQEIKQKLSITALLNHYGIEIQRGEQINCPFHSLLARACSSCYFCKNQFLENPCCSTCVNSTIIKIYFY
jgi:hypothetical protein